jgi:plasmid stability protein
VSERRRPGPAEVIGRRARRRVGQPESATRYTWLASIAIGPPDAARLPAQEREPAKTLSLALGAFIMQNACMPILQIRDLPDDVYQRVLAAARAEQRSLSQQAVVELRRALGASAENRRSAVILRLRASGRRLPVRAPRPEALQREDRDLR